MNTFDILNLCNRDPTIRSFSGVYACDNLPNKFEYPNSLIANTKPSNHTGEHWIAIYVNKQGYGDFFDSYGRPPQREFKRFLDKHCVSWNFSKKQLQQYTSTTCGQHCVFFIHARSLGLSLTKFLSLFTSNRAENDDIVCAYINGRYRVNTVVYDNLFQ